MWLNIFSSSPKIEESPRIYLSLRNPQRERMSIHLFLNSSSRINHYEESHLVYGPLGSILEVLCMFLSLKQNTWRRPKDASAEMLWRQQSEVIKIIKLQYQKLWDLWVLKYSLAWSSNQMQNNSFHDKIHNLPEKWPKASSNQLKMFLVRKKERDRTDSKQLKGF